MKKNKELNKARKDNKDEFYTQMTDICNELQYYQDHFKGKTVFCNCDDPYESNFFKYFALNFNRLGLKKLICTCWNGSPITGNELPFNDLISDNGRCRTAYKIIITELKDMNGNSATDLDDIKLYLKKNPPEILSGNGDFRSKECIDLLKESDIVVTNPPFSLFREFIYILIKYGKEFLIIGNINAVTYRDVFPLIAENKVWLGASANNNTLNFLVPDDYEIKEGAGNVDASGNKYIKVSGITWFTNMMHNMRKKKYDLSCKYDKTKYQQYDNSNIINVDKSVDIPEDYNGIMGVPITFLSKYCPDQFEILGLANSARYLGPIECLTIINGRKIYNRLFIRKKKKDDNSKE